jgi:hypothetical protein
VDGIIYCSVNTQSLRFAVLTYLNWAYCHLNFFNKTLTFTHSIIQHYLICCPIENVNAWRPKSETPGTLSNANP